MKALLRPFRSSLVALDKIELPRNSEAVNKQSDQRTRLDLFSYRTHGEKTDTFVDENKIL